MQEARPLSPFVQNNAVFLACRLQLFTPSVRDKYSDFCWHEIELLANQLESQFNYEIAEKHAGQRHWSAFVSGRAGL